MAKKEAKKRPKKKKTQKRETILAFGAHSDDFVIGLGGTIAKYKREGKQIISLVFSYGEKSHPWLKEEIIQKMRSREALEASKLLGCKTYIYDLEDNNIYEDYHKKAKTRQEILDRIKKHPPTKIFTHSFEDPHPDHRAVHRITLEIWETLPQPKPEVYIYSIWNPVSLKTDYPVLYEDISETFSLKIIALKSFRSQRFNAIYPLILFIYYRAIKNGLKIRKRFAEKFFRIK